MRPTALFLTRRAALAGVLTARRSAEKRARRTRRRVADPRPDPDRLNVHELANAKLGEFPLAVFAGVTAFTGSRTPVLPMKMCPFIDTGVAALFVLGST